MNVGIYIENQKIDLFNDEAISIVASVLSIQDITINTTDYSRSFTVPASYNNNKIFKHYYNADIDNAFDARKKVTARIEIGGTVFKDGKIVLTKVQMKHGRPSSYMLNFFGMLVSLKDILGSDKLSVLNLSAYNAIYEPTFIKNLLTDNHTNNDLICSLLSKRKYFYASNTDDFDETIHGNLWYDATALPKNGIYWRELTPSFLVRKIIEQIEIDYGLNFTGGFFSSDMFDNIYLCLDNGLERAVSAVETALTVDMTGGPYSWIHNTYVEATVIPTYRYDVLVRFAPQAGYEYAQYILRIYNNSVLIEQIETTGIITIPVTLDKLGINKLEYTVEVKEKIKYKTTVDVREYISGALNDSEYATRAIADTLTANYSVSANMPDITILDFIKGLIQAFKLVIVPVSDTEIYINTVDIYYSEGNTIDITKYVDISQIEVSRPDLLNKISFKFKDPKTILNKQFKSITNEGYGDEILYIYDDEGKLIDGGSVDIQLPFEQIVYERLIDSETNTNTNIQYGALINENLESTHIEPHIHYSVLRSIGKKSIAYNNGSLTELSGYYYSPSHIKSDSNFGTGFIFGSEIEEFSKSTITDSLYTEYYQSYINSLFKIKRRNYSIDAKNIPLHIISQIQLNDTIVIGINYFRINSMDINITTREIKFNLFNI